MLQAAIQKKKQLQLQRNKPLRADVFRFVRWLRTFAAGYQMYGGVEDEDKPAKQAKAQDSRGYISKRPEDKKSERGAGPTKPRSQEGVARSDTSSTLLENQLRV